MKPSRYQPFVDAGTQRPDCKSSLLTLQNLDLFILRDDFWFLQRANFRHYLRDIGPAAERAQRHAVTDGYYRIYRLKGYSSAFSFIKIET